MGYGDEILAAGQAQRLFDSTGLASKIYDKNKKPRWHPIWEGNPAILTPDDPRVHHSIVNGPNCRPYITYPFTTESGWTFNTDFHARDNVARIYLTADEKAIGADLFARHGSYVLIEPWSKHPNLRWPRAHWQALIDSRPELTFIQHIHGATDYLLDRVICVGTPTFRAACGALQFARAYIRGESGMLHAAAALGIPAVAIWGECMDWDVLGGYTTHIGVGIKTPPCGSWKACTNCIQTMIEIKPRSVADALDMALLIPRPAR